MPCTNEGYPPTEEETLYALVPNMLCAVLSVVHENELMLLLSRIDWPEAGVTRKQFEKWWRGHQKKDAQRRLEERQEADRKALAKSARSKLTKEERKALGLR